MENGVIQQYLVILSFFLAIAGFTIGEAFWLSKKNWAGFGKSLGFSVITNLIGYSVGFFLFFVAFAIVLGMSWDGANKYPTGFSVALVSLGLAVLFVPLLLILCKRVFLAVLKMQTGKSAWLFSIISSLVSLLTIVVPILLGYLLFRQW